MNCNTCGQSSCECKLGTYACPKLSNPPTCNELKDFKENMMDELANNREYVSGCNPDSIVRYVDSIMERISCLNDQEIIALCSIFDSIAKLRNTDVGNHMSLSADKNTLTLTRKKLDGTVVASDNVHLGIGDLDDIIFSVIRFDYDILDSHLAEHLHKGEITNAGFVDARLELEVTTQIPAGMYRIAKINEVKAQPLGSIINGVTIDSTTYELYGSAAIRDEYIYMNVTKTIPVGRFLHFSFAYRNFNASTNLYKGE